MAERNPATMSYLKRRMDHMSMSSSPMFRTFDSKLARAYWYIIAGILGFILLLRAVDYYQTWSRSVISEIHKSRNVRGSMPLYKRHLTQVCLQTKNMPNEEIDKIPNEGQQLAHESLCDCHSHLARIELSPTTHQQQVVFMAEPTSSWTITRLTLLLGSHCLHDDLQSDS